MRKRWFSILSVNIYEFGYELWVQKTNFWQNTSNIIINKMVKKSTNKKKFPNQINYKLVRVRRMIITSEKNLHTWTRQVIILWPKRKSSKCKAKSNRVTRYREYWWIWKSLSLHITIDFFCLCTNIVKWHIYPKHQQIDKPAIMENKRTGQSKTTFYCDKEKMWRRWQAMKHEKCREGSY